MKDGSTGEHREAVEARCGYRGEVWCCVQKSNTESPRNQHTRSHLRNKTTNGKQGPKCLCENCHSSIAHCGQVKTTQESIDRGVDEINPVRTRSGILFSHRK